MDWTHGYVTDLAYTSGYYDDLDPARLAFAILAQGFRPPSLHKPFTYCELGCGRGVTTAIVAAANPNAFVWANDFNPTHIADARVLASGLSNVQFSDAGFDEITEDSSLPQFDFIVLHGIYSWIDEDLRNSIISFAKKKLAVGGVLYVSYNAKPGWTPTAPVAELMRIHATRQGAGSIPNKIESAQKFIDSIIASDAAFFKVNSASTTRFVEMRSQPSAYVAHEYMNAAWTIFSHADVVQDLSAAKLTYVTSSTLLDQLPHLVLSPDQAKLLGEISDPILREVARDFIVNQQFRKDIYIKGPMKLSRDELGEYWAQLRFAAVKLPDEKDLTPTTRLGQAQLRPEVYGPLLALLDRRPHTVAELLEDPAIAAMGASTLRSALLTLAAFRRIAPSLTKSEEVKRSLSTSILNKTLLDRAKSSSEIPFLVSSVSGGGIPVGRIDQLFIQAEERGLHPPDFIWSALKENNERLMHEGKNLETADETLAQLAIRYQSFRPQRDLLKNLGVVPETRQPS